MTARRALITGVSGQDGSYLAERLLDEGVEVHAISLHDEASEHVPADVEMHAGDITDVEHTRALTLALKPDLIVNLAAVSSVARSWHEPELVSQVNGAAAVAMLETAFLVRERGTDVRFLQASSAEIFGEPSISPQHEDTAIAPVNPYGVAKAYAHLMTGVYRTRGLHASSLILYNHESPRRPPQFVTRKITSTVAAIANGTADELVLGNLDVRRDWGWAPDYVDALTRAAAADQPGDYVIATGVTHMIRDFVAAAFAHVGIADWERLVRVDAALARPADAAAQQGDATKARTHLGWRPTVGFDEIVARMVAADLDPS